MPIGFKLIEREGGQSYTKALTTPHRTSWHAESTVATSPPTSVSIYRTAD
jgi:hypothetical protein